MTIVTRETKETRIQVQIERARDPRAVETSVVTGEPFLDHMLATLAHYAAFDLHVTAAGDLRHHLIEDTAIAMGQAVALLVPTGAARYADRTIPMDDALVQVAIDVGGRPYYRGKLPSTFYDHWMRSFATNARATLHLRVLRGHDRHHIIEAGFKALGFSLRDALVDAGSVLSTKGSVQ
jgi:imidazoleglycerol-phosphate dehydratase